jgi:hypothetical protein
LLIADFAAKRPAQLLMTYLFFAAAAAIKSSQSLPRCERSQNTSIHPLVLAIFQPLAIEKLHARGRQKSRSQQAARDRILAH